LSDNLNVETKKTSILSSPWLFFNFLCKI